MTDDTKIIPFPKREIKFHKELLASVAIDFIKRRVEIQMPNGGISLDKQGTLEMIAVLTSALKVIDELEKGKDND
jgi:hypothetical protein